MDFQEEFTLTLRKPIELGGVSYEKLELREPTSGEIQKVSVLAMTDPAASNILLVSLVSGAPKTVIEKIGIRDLTTALKYLMGFMPADPETGKP